jgi:hypothetical protein
MTNEEKAEQLEEMAESLETLRSGRLIRFDSYPANGQPLAERAALLREAAQLMRERDKRSLLTERDWETMYEAQERDLAALRKEREGLRAERQDAMGLLGKVIDEARRCFKEHRARIADLEAELDAAKAGEEALRRKWQREECAHCGERPEGHNGTMWCAECFEWWVRESEQECITQLRADLEAARAGEARAVEALKRIREELETIAAGKEEEVRNDFSSGESHGWGSAYLHVCRIIGNAATQPAIDWLAQREREAAARELNQLGPLGSSKQEVFMVPWSEIKQRIAALANQQPTACPRSEVRGKERFRA